MSSECARFANLTTEIIDINFYYNAVGKYLKLVMKYYRFRIRFLVTKSSPWRVKDLENGDLSLNVIALTPYSLLHLLLIYFSCPTDGQLFLPSMTQVIVFKLFYFLTCYKKKQRRNINNKNNSYYFTLN